jgi:hypothetical protein
MGDIRDGKSNQPKPDRDIVDLSYGPDPLHRRRFGRPPVRCIPDRVFDDPAADVRDWRSSSGLQFPSGARDGSMVAVLVACRARPTRFGRGSGISLGGSDQCGACRNSRGPCRGCLRWRLYVTACPRRWGVAPDRTVQPYEWRRITVHPRTCRSSYRRHDLRPPEKKTSEPAIEPAIETVEAPPVRRPGVLLRLTGGRSGHLPQRGEHRPPRRRGGARGADPRAAPGDCRRRGCSVLGDDGGGGQRRGAGPECHLFGDVHLDAEFSAGLKVGPGLESKLFARLLLFNSSY